MDTIRIFHGDNITIIKDNVVNTIDVGDLATFLTILSIVGHAKVSEVSEPTSTKLDEVEEMIRKLKIDGEFYDQFILSTLLHAMPSDVGEGTIMQRLHQLITKGSSDKNDCEIGNKSVWIIDKNNKLGRIRRGSSKEAYLLYQDIERGSKDLINDEIINQLSNDGIDKVTVYPIEGDQLSSIRTSKIIKRILMIIIIVTIVIFAAYLAYHRLTTIA